MMKKEIRLWVYHTAEDDPKKCSARKMARFGLVNLASSMKRIPPGLILLDPFAEKSFSPEDADIACPHGILALDCSWKTAEEQFAHASHLHHSRALPFVIAVNPVNYGKPLKLSTLEAFVTALYILGKLKQAKTLVNLYKWAPHFLTMNQEPLEEYRTAKTSADIIEIMHRYIDADK